MFHLLSNQLLNIKNKIKQHLQPWTRNFASKEPSALLEAYILYGNVEELDKATKCALRLCNKHFKNLVDANVSSTITCVSNNLNNRLNDLIKGECHGIKRLRLRSYGHSPNPMRELPSALFVKFSGLEELKIQCPALRAIPADGIGELKRLKSLQLSRCRSLKALPDSLGTLTTLEKLVLTELTNEGLAPLQHLTGLTSLVLSLYGQVTKYPDFLWDLRPLKELYLGSRSIKTLPTALGNLTNLESLTIRLRKLKQLPDFIGDLKALKSLRLYKRQNSVLSPTTQEVLQRLRQRGAQVRVSECKK